MNESRVLPFWTMYRRNAKPLRGLAMDAVQNTYKHHWHLVNVLPKTLQEELLEKWLQCNENVPISDDDLKIVKTVVNKGWKGMGPWCPQVFVYIMMLPRETPSFAHEDNHLIYRYYRWKKLDGSVLNLCLPCFVCIAKAYRQYSANYWLDKGWQFYEVKDHVRVAGEDLIYTLWERTSWCDHCICEPLIEDIIDYDECVFDYNYHNKRRRGYSDSDLSDSDDDCQVNTLIAGKRMDPDMYSLMKKNMFFEW